jgi:hypothetical protein
VDVKNIDWVTHSKDTNFDVKPIKCDGGISKSESCHDLSFSGIIHRLKIKHVPVALFIQWYLGKPVSKLSWACNCPVEVETPFP